jgi:hypothetical protein
MLVVRKMISGGSPVYIAKSVGNRDAGFGIG